MTTSNSDERNQYEILNAEDMQVIETRKSETLALVAAYLLAKEGKAVIVHRHCDEFWDLAVYKDEETQGICFDGTLIAAGGPPLKVPDGVFDENG